MEECQRYERRFYASKSGLTKALRRWEGTIVHYFESRDGWILCRRLS